jgi:hypothetical protein
MAMIQLRYMQPWGCKRCENLGTGSQWMVGDFLPWCDHVIWNMHFTDFIYTRLFGKMAVIEQNI